MKIESVINVINRNKYTISGDPVPKGVVLERWNGRENVGDYISCVIFDWILEKNHLIAKEGKRAHLFTVGSILGISRADGVVWGSGVISAYKIRNVIKRSNYIKYDIRALRGPITRDICFAAGYDCRDVPLGDPGVLLPLIVEKKKTDKKYRYCLINHYVNEEHTKITEADGITISAGTNDYRSFVDRICESEIVISSSLHGIILAEAYGVPAIWLLENMEGKTLKYYDYYYSTNRYSIPVARNLDEALTIKPIHLPENLEKMQCDLLKAFPYDLWGEELHES